MLVRSLPWAPLVVAPQTKNNEEGWLERGWTRCGSHSRGVYRGMNISYAQDHFLQRLHRGSGPTHTDHLAASGRYMRDPFCRCGNRDQVPEVTNTGTVARQGQGQGRARLVVSRVLLGCGHHMGPPRTLRYEPLRGALHTSSGSPSSSMSPSTGGGNRGPQNRPGQGRSARK